MPRRPSSIGAPSATSSVAPPAPPRSPLQLWYGVLARHIATKQERAYHDDKLEHKCLLFTINLQLLLGAGTCLFMFPFLPWAHVKTVLPYPTAFMAGALASLVHMAVTKRTSVSRFAATWFLQLMTCATFWSFGGVVPSAGVLLIPFFAPHVSFILDTEYRLAGPLRMFALSCLVVVARATVDLALGPGALTPLVIRLPAAAMTVISLLVIMTCSVVFVGSTAIMVRRLQRRARALQRSMHEATGVAQRVVNWELDAVPKPRGDGGVVDLMVQVAEKLRAYRPYLPAHLFAAAAAADDDLSDVDEARSVLGRSASLDGQGPASPVTGDALPRVPTQPGRAGDPPAAKELLSVTRAAEQRSLGPHHGTLLSARVSQTEEGAAGLAAVSYEVVQRVADVFSRVAADAAHATRGMLQAVGHDHCLILWNVLPKGASHVEHGLMAALMIREGFARHCGEAGLEGLTVSMGLWAGTFVSGTLHLGDMMSYACLGQGPEQALALREYAATFGRGIVCNHRAFDATKAAPRHRLVPVDVLSFSSKGARGELVYECVCELQSDADEWMYQIEAQSSALWADRRLRKLLLQVSKGGACGTILWAARSSWHTAGRRRLRTACGRRRVSSKNSQTTPATTSTTPNTPTIGRR